ncbi:hypothetical protein HS125_17755 [bacterium]|nr:hypothetical protein [bacterium]
MAAIPEATVSDLEEMDADDAAERPGRAARGGLGPRDRILAGMEPEEAHESAPSCSIGDTAGGIMSPDFVALTPHDR